MLETGTQGATSLAPTGDVSMHPEALVPARSRGCGELSGGVGVVATSAKMAKVRPRPGVFAIMLDAASCAVTHIFSHVPLRCRFQTVLTVEDASAGKEVLPTGAHDVNGSQVDLRRKHSWLLKMQEVLADVHPVRTIAIVRRIFDLYEACDRYQHQS